jgi:membrane protein CcdC involved in cytochrome C biogenesis
MYLSPDSILNFIKNPKEYLAAIVIFILFMLVVISVSKFNVKNEAH